MVYTWYTIRENAPRFAAQGLMSEILLREGKTPQCMIRDVTPPSSDSGVVREAEAAAAVTKATASTAVPAITMMVAALAE